MDNFTEKDSVVKQRLAANPQMASLQLDDAVVYSFDLAMELETFTGTFEY